MRPSLVLFAITGRVLRHCAWITGKDRSLFSIN
jgi:hypothetical protein